MRAKAYFVCSQQSPNETPDFRLLFEYVLCDRAGDGPPNILIVLVDDIGYGVAGCYNPESKISTPNIDRLSREGMRFTDAHAPGPLCHPSRDGLMTGRDPFRTDVSLWPTQPLIEKGLVTIASLLRDEGYHTAMVGKWHLGFRGNGDDQTLPGGPVDCGFNRFFGLRASTDIPPSASTMMIRSGDWKFIDRLGSGGFSKPAKIQPEPGGPKGQLYKLRDDGAETKDLFIEYPEMVTRLEAEMERIKASGHDR